MIEITKTITYGTKDDFGRLMWSKNLSVEAKNVRGLTFYTPETREVLCGFEKYEPHQKEQPKIKGWKYGSLWEIPYFFPRNGNELLEAGLRFFDDSDEKELCGLFGGRLPAFMTSRHTRDSWMGVHPILVSIDRGSRWNVWYQLPLGQNGYWIYVKK